MEDIIVIDIETNKEFILCLYDKDSDWCIISNVEYGTCRQHKSLLELKKFTTNIQHVSNNVINT